MSHASHSEPSPSTGESFDLRRSPSGRFPLTDMPTALMITLVAVGLPRTILADLDVVAPESGPIYYLIALAPYAAWLLVAVLRRSRRPFRDFLVLGTLYGLSLIVVHTVLWGAPAGYGHRPPPAAVGFAEQVGAGWYEVALRAHTSAVAMLIGVGSGVVVALVALGVHLWRSRRTPAA